MDAFVEEQWATFYAPVLARPSLAHRRYFRLLWLRLLRRERAIAWRAADSLSVRSFLQLELHDPAPDHSTISRTRRLIDSETRAAVFTWIPQRLADTKITKMKDAQTHLAQKAEHAVDGALTAGCGSLLLR